MDGNGRWAKQRGLPRLGGHSKGAQVFGEIARHAAKTAVEYLTVYAFSTENWKRPPEEVAGIMDLLRKFLDDADKYRGDNIRVRILGDKAGLKADLQEKIARLERESAGNTALNLNIALNYGGRDEILRAAKSIAESYKHGALDLGRLDEREFERFLYTAGMPDVDLIIRTSGERRTSNFLPWQSVYAEYYLTDILWPDFRPKHFDEALRDYAKRTRRLGGV
jgi:undecaprenyl diphosphate synthase